MPHHINKIIILLVPDYLVCGNCTKQFSIDSMASFILHKRMDCNDSLSKIGHIIYYFPKMVVFYLGYSIQYYDCYFT